MLIPSQSKTTLKNSIDIVHFRCYVLAISRNVFETMLHGLERLGSFTPVEVLAEKSGKNKHY